MTPLLVFGVLANWKKRFAPWTMLTWTNNLRHALRWLDHHAGSELAHEVPRLRKPRPREVTATPEEVAALIRVARPWERLWLMFCIFLGVRRADAMQLSAQHWYSEASELRWTQQKTGEAQVLPVPPELAAYLNNAPTGPPEQPFLARYRTKKSKLTPDVLHRSWHNMKRRAGITRDLYPHDLRRTAATALMEFTKDIRAVQQFLGHRALSSTAHYIARLAPEEMRAQLEALMQRFPTEKLQ